MSGYAPEIPVAAFERSRSLFESVVTMLGDPGTGERTHAELEEALTVDSRELVRQLFQDHLDLRAVREQRRPQVVDAAGVRHTRVEPGHQRSLATVFGEVTVTRMAYRAPGTTNLYPADVVLNLPAEKHSHGLRRLAAIEAVRGSFGDASQAIARQTGTLLGKRQVEQLAQHAAADIGAFYRARRPDACPADRVLVLTADGKGIVMRTEALRELTARAARNGEHKLATRLSPGEKLGRKRMAEVGGVYDAAPIVRTPEGIITTGDARPQPGPVASGKWLTASVADSAQAVIGQVFDEAQRRDPDHLRPWAVLVDGNRHQIDRVTDQAARRKVTVTIVIDFIHVLEYLWKAAWSLFDHGDGDAETWVADQARKVLDGKAGTVAATIRRTATRGGYSQAERKGADTCANYLTSKKPYLDYPTALASGWPIATGIIEGACRHLVKDRMDLTGARWGLDGAEAILQLRALTANGDFDAYLAFHLQQEHQRVHETRYQRHRVDYTLAA
jgi:hypothetical protein